MRFGVYFETKMAYFHKEIIIVFLDSYAWRLGGFIIIMLHEKILKIWYSLERFGVYNFIRLYLEKLIYFYIENNYYSNSFSYSSRKFFENM